jgi:hypothetical protein
MLFLFTKFKNKGVFMCRFIIMCALFFVLIVPACKTSEEINAKNKADRMEEAQQEANRIARGMHYIEVRGICYSYFWGGWESGAHTLATVPCEKIPPELLVKAE